MYPHLPVHRKNSEPLVEIENVTQLSVVSLTVAKRPHSCAWCDQQADVLPSQLSGFAVLFVFSPFHNLFIGSRHAVNFDMNFTVFHTGASYVVPSFSEHLKSGV